MITGQFNNEIFAQEQWNSKLDAYIREEFGEERLVDRFVGFLSDGEAINSLNLNRVFIITTSESASASELLINGLASYIEVIQVGEQTVGKNVASITLYDYIDNDGTRNPDHTYAMQPIVLKIANNDGFADYDNGLEPNKLVEENIRDLGVLGSPDETLFEAVLSVLSGTEKLSSKSSSYSKSLLIKDPLTEQRQRMFVDKEELLLSQSIR
jgi:C-terminal processing protease CtpA/Prc